MNITTVTPELKVKTLRNLTKHKNIRMEDFEYLFESLDLQHFHISGIYDSDYHDAIRPFNGYVTQYLGECVKKQQGDINSLSHTIEALREVTRNQQKEINKIRMNSLIAEDPVLLGQIKSLIESSTKTIKPIELKEYAQPEYGSFINSKF